MSSRDLGNGRTRHAKNRMASTCTILFTLLLSFVPFPYGVAVTDEPPTILFTPKAVHAVHTKGLTPIRSRYELLKDYLRSVWYYEQ